MLFWLYTKRSHPLTSESVSSCFLHSVLFTYPNISGNFGVLNLCDDTLQMWGHQDNKTKKIYDKVCDQVLK